jgi:hypothetical protein
VETLLRSNGHIENSVSKRKRGIGIELATPINDKTKSRDPSPLSCPGGTKTDQALLTVGIIRVVCDIRSCTLLSWLPQAITSTGH